MIKARPARIQGQICGWRCPTGWLACRLLTGLPFTLLPVPELSRPVSAQVQLPATFAPHGGGQAGQSMDTGQIAHSSRPTINVSKYRKLHMQALPQQVPCLHLTGSPGRVIGSAMKCSAPTNNMLYVHTGFCFQKPFAFLPQRKPSAQASLSKQTPLKRVEQRSSFHCRYGSQRAVIEMLASLNPSGGMWLPLRALILSAIRHLVSLHVEQPPGSIPCNARVPWRSRRRVGCATLQMASPRQ